MEKTKQKTTDELLEEVKELRLNVERFRLVVNAPIALFTQDRDLRFTWVYNPAPGFDPSLLIGKTDAEVAPPEVAKAPMALKRQVLETGKPARKEIPFTIEGKTTWHDLYVEPHRGEAGGVIGVTCMSIDITDRKEAEQATKEKEERLAKFMVSATDSCVILDSELNVTDINDVTLKWMNMSREETINKHILELSPGLKPQGRYDEYLKVLETGKPFDLVDEIHIPDTEKIMYLHIRAFRVGDGLGIVTTDLTEIKKAEAEIKELNRMLEQRVEERTAELEKANQGLEEFAYVAAHDLKAPVTNISTLAEMMDGEAIGDERRKKLFDRLKIAIGQLHKIVFTLNDVIAFKTTLKDEKERVSFEELFSEIKESVVDQIEATQATVKHDFSKCPEIDYPPVHLRSVMQNLLTNSLKYNNPDKPLKIEVRTTESNGRVCLTVKDNGLGFDASKEKKMVTGLFTRLHTHVEGIGVGMYIVKSIVDSHGGKIEIKSKPNKGALFTVYLSDGENE